MVLLIRGWKDIQVMSSKHDQHFNAINTINLANIYLHYPLKDVDRKMKLK